MTPATAQPRLARLVLVLVLLALVGAGCGRSEPRPSGVVERWLQAVSDQGRTGLVADARQRAAEYADPSVAVSVVPERPEADERHFSDFEVGKASEGPLGARVPFRVTRRIEGGGTDEFRGTAVLARSGGGWLVTSVETPASGEVVPSEGGALPARANASQWAFAAVLGIALTALSVVLIEAQPRPGAPPTADPA